MGLVWREQLSVGNNMIDSDRKHLIVIINQVEDAMAAHNGKQLATTLEELSQYSLMHFAREEKIASAAGYTQVPLLHQSHEMLFKRLDAVRGEIDAMGNEWSPEAAQRFTLFLRNWLVDHVIKEDLLMKPVLQKLSPAFMPI